MNTTATSQQVMKKGGYDRVNSCRRQNKWCSAAPGSTRQSTVTSANRRAARVRKGKELDGDDVDVEEG
jgi:hypothetical protein